MNNEIDSPEDTVIASDEVNSDNSLLDQLDVIDGVIKDLNDNREEVTSDLEELVIGLVDVNSSLNDIACKDMDEKKAKIRKLIKRSNFINWSVIGSFAVLVGGVVAMGGSNND